MVFLWPGVLIIGMIPLPPAAAILVLSMSSAAGAVVVRAFVRLCVLETGAASGQGCPEFHCAGWRLSLEVDAGMRMVAASHPVLPLLPAGGSVPGVERGRLPPGAGLRQWSSVCLDMLREAESDLRPFSQRCAGSGPLFARSAGWFFRFGLSGRSRHGRGLFVGMLGIPRNINFPDS